MKSYVKLAVKYAVFYAVLAFFVFIREIPIPIPIPGYVISAFQDYLIFPLMIALPFSFAGALLSQLEHRTIGQLIRKLVYYPILIYYFLSGLFVFIFYDYIYLFWPSVLIFFSLLLASFSSDLIPQARSTVRWLSLSVIFYSAYLIVLTVYSPVTPIFYWAIILSVLMAAAASIKIFSNRMLREVGTYIANAAPKVFLLFFFFLIIYYSSYIPFLSAYSSYIRLFTLFLSVLAVAYMAYRVYSIASGYAESMAEKIYSQHAREVKLVGVEEASDLYSAVMKFLQEGKKEDLLVYASYQMALSGFDMESAKKHLERLMAYERPDVELLAILYSPRRLKEMISEDAEERKRIVEALLSAAPKQTAQQNKTY